VRVGRDEEEATRRRRRGGGRDEEEDVTRRRRVEGRGNARATMEIADRVLTHHL